MYRNIFIGLTMAVYLTLPCGVSAQDKATEIRSALDEVEITQPQNSMNTTYPVEMINAALPEGSGVRTVIDIGEPSAPKAVPVVETIKSLDVKDKSLESVLELIGQQTGIIFVLPDQIPGKVTVALSDVNVWDLLNLLLQQHGLAYYKTSGVVHVMSRDVFQNRYGYDFVSGYPARIVSVHYVSLEILLPLLNVARSPKGRVWIDTKNKQVLMIDVDEKVKELEALIQQQDVLRESREFVLKRISFDDVKDSINAVVTPYTGVVQYEADKKMLRVTDSSVKLDQIREILEKMDRDVVVPFDIQVVRIELNEEHASGVDWEAIISAYQRYPLQASNGQTVSEEISIGTVTQEDYDVLIDALDTVGELEHLLRYRIEPVLNQRRDFDVDTNDPFWSLRPGAREYFAGPAVLDPSGFEMKFSLLVKDSGDEFGIEFLPRLHWMEPDSGHGGVRIFEAKDALALALEKQDVVVIGGLIRVSEISKTRKVPVLGDLPMLGTVFRRQRTKFENTEYIIFLRPAAKTP